MNETAARQRLSEAGWLAAMPAAFRADLLDICVWKHFAAGQPLYTAGDPPGGMFGVASGAITATVALGRPDSPAAYIGQAVTWTGIGSLVSDQPRRVSTVAVEPVVAAYVPLRALQAMLAADPTRWRYFAMQLLMEFDIASTIANDLLIRSAERRCAAALLRVANCRFGPPATAPAVARLTQETLAEMTNLSRSSISAILGDLVDRGFIAIAYRSVRLLDVGTLQAVADGD